MERHIFNKTNRFIVKHRFLLFFGILMLLLFLLPFLQNQARIFVVLLELSFSLLLIVGIFIVSADRRILVIAILLSILTITIIWFNLILKNQALSLLSLILEVLFLCLTTSVIINHVLQYKRVTVDKIYGAICGYFLLGVIWALIYTLIEIAYPGAFSFTHPITTGHADQLLHHFYFSQFFYYSFTTLTTLGHGDIVPVLDLARVVSSFQAMFGQLYIAVLISRLVGLHIVHSGVKS